jgi:3alpha(or 20beta)-hydroxysteroid dehydrogenase
MGSAAVAARLLGAVDDGRRSGARRVDAELSGKVALVTGGATGMGAAHVRRLAGAGASVVAADVRDDDASALAESLGTAVRWEHLDVRDADGWRRVVQATEERMGPIEVLVNNAGVIEWGGVADMSEPRFRHVLDVNVVGVFLGMQAVVPSMRRVGQGSIINISSTAGMVGAPAAVAYTASKWAVRGMTKAAALELAPFRIRVNSVHPGLIHTPMSQAAGSTSGTPPLGRVGEPDDVAWAVVHLASDASSYTTGAEIVIDGGRLAGW